MAQDFIKRNITKSLFFILITTALSFGQNQIIITDDFETITLDEALEYHEDITGALSIQDIMSLSKGKFRSLEGYTNLGFSKSSFWVRFQIQNKKKAGFVRY